MGYVPEDVEWFLTEIVEEIKIDDEPRNVIHINMILIRADSAEEAYEKALELGSDAETTYENPDGKLVTITFRGLRDLWPIIDKLEHGAELTYDEEIGYKEEQITKLIRSKEQLAVFRPIERTSGPNYMPKHILDDLRKHFPDEELFGGEAD
jgi:hypothetical protein